MNIFDKEYDSLSLVDIEDDVYDAINNNEYMPFDEHGFTKGTFRVTISWSEE